MERILEHLLAQPTAVERLTGVDAWWQRHRAVAEGFAEPVDRAIAGAFAADRLGFAFASGYQEALRALVPGLGEAKVALCATEDAGNHPAAIQTRLEPDGDGWRVSGNKSFATLGTHSDELLVVAGLGVDAAGLHRLAIVRAPSNRDGVSVSAGAQMPFAPEIPHARVVLTDVAIGSAERLPGDGYADYLKPFRTVEDCHVHTATLAYLLRVCRASQWPDGVAQRLLSAIALGRALALASPTSAAVHIALAGLVEQAAALEGDLESHWATADAHVASMWRRDRPLIGVAARARSRRLEVAWERVRAAGR